MTRLTCPSPEVRHHDLDGAKKGQLPQKKKKKKKNRISSTIFGSIVTVWGTRVSVILWLLKTLFEKFSVGDDDAWMIFLFLFIDI